MEYSDDDLISLGFGIADGSLNYEDDLSWIQKYKVGPADGRGTSL